MNFPAWMRKVPVSAANILESELKKQFDGEKWSYLVKSHRYCGKAIHEEMAVGDIAT